MACLVEVADYDELRSYVGGAEAIYVTGYLVTAAPDGITGLFVKDNSDSTSTDDGGTIIVGTRGVNLGTRWKRAFKGGVNIRWFGATADGVTDDTTAIQNALNYAKSFSALANELTVIWPGGDYRVTSLNFVGCTRVTMQALGGVNIYGISTSGSGAIIDLDGGLVTQTRKLNFLGNFSVQIGSGGAYQYGIKISYLNDSIWSYISVSGAYTVNTVYINYTWDNPRLEIYATNSSGTAIATIKCDSNNVNRNHFNLRTTGSTDMSIASIGFELNGVANTVEGDFSSSQIGIKLVNARASTILATYHEVNKYCIAATTGNSSGNVILGGFYEAGTNGAAFDLSSTENTTIVSPFIKGVGGGSGRVAFAMGTACYGLNVIAPDIDSTTIDTVYTGTWRGSGAFASDFKTLGAQWIGFPPTQEASSDVNTFDDYEEGSWTPTLTCATPGDLAITYSSRFGSYTKKGREVTASFTIASSAFTYTTATGQFRITGLPFTSGGSPSGRAVGSIDVSGLTKAGYTNFVAFIDLSSATLLIRASGSGVASASCNITDFPTAGTVQLFCTIVYQTTT